MRISDWSSDVCSSDLLARRILPICLISGRCAPDCGMAQHGDGAVAWMVGASRPSPGQKDWTGALFAKPPPAHARGPRLTSRSRGLSLVSARPGSDPACGRSHLGGFTPLFPSFVCLLWLSGLRV